MTDNVIDFTGETLLDIVPEKILKAALAADLDCVVVVGSKKDGSLYLASGPAELNVTYWLLSVARKNVIEMVDD